MKILTILSVLVFCGNIFATDLEDAQKKIIDLQSENIELLKKLTKSYKSGAVCYRYLDDCVNEQTNLNKILALFSNQNVSIKTSCHKEIAAEGTVCYGNNFLLSADVKITP